MKVVANIMQPVRLNTFNSWTNQLVGHRVVPAVVARWRGNPVFRRELHRASRKVIFLDRQSIFHWKENCSSHIYRSDSASAKAFQLLDAKGPAFESQCGQFCTLFNPLSRHAIKYVYMFGQYVGNF